MRVRIVGIAEVLEGLDIGAESEPTPFFPIGIGIAAGLAELLPELMQAWQDEAEGLAVVFEFDRVAPGMSVATMSLPIDPEPTFWETLRAKLSR